MAIVRVKELRVYRDGFKAAMRIFVCSRDWPPRRARGCASPAGAAISGADAFADLDATYDRLCGGLVRMMHDPDPRCGPASATHEPPSPYAS